MNLVFKNTDTRRYESRSCWWSSMIREWTAGRFRSSCVCQGPLADERAAHVALDGDLACLVV